LNSPIGLWALLSATAHCKQGKLCTIQDLTPTFFDPQALANIAKLAGLKPTQSFSAFAVKGALTLSRRTAKAAGAPSRYFVTVGTPRDGQADKVKRGVAVVAKEMNGRIVGYRIYHQR
jgi:hypothetical protein